MILYTEDKVKVPANKCKKPSFNDHGGRTWDTGRIEIDGKEYDAHLDTTWGECIYIQYDDVDLKWYKIRMRPLNICNDENYDVDPFGYLYKITSLTTKI